MLDKTPRPNKPTNHPTPKRPWMKHKTFLLLLVLGIVFVLLALIPEDNEGTPGKNMEAEEFRINCGLNDADCHRGSEYESLDIYIVQDRDDQFLFAAPLERDGEKMDSDDYEVQAKAVALDGKERYIAYLDATDNTGQLDLSDYDPKDGEEFWMGFGYRDSANSTFLYIKDPGYEFRDKEYPPVPVAHISLSEDFVDDPEQTITVREGDDDKTLNAAMPRDGIFTLYFDGGNCTDQDGDELTYYWDLNGNGNYETGESGDQLDERGVTRQYDYTEPGSYQLKFRVGDGRFETDSLFFTLVVEETEKKPELFVESIVVEDEAGESVEAEQERGEVLTIKAYIRNYDEGGYGKATEDNVEVWVYYAFGSEDYQDWYLFDGTPVDVGRININSQKRLELRWDTEATQGEEDESYRIKLVVDQNDAVPEWDEDNNEEIHDSIIDVVYVAPPEPPQIELGEIWLSRDPIYENNETHVNINMTNDGAGPAENVVVTLFVNDKEKGSSSQFTIPAGQTMELNDTPTRTFVWASGREDRFNLRVELSYFYEGQEYSHEQELEDVEVREYQFNRTVIKVEVPPEDDPWLEGSAFFALAAVVGVGAIGAFVYVVKRE